MKKYDFKLMKRHKGPKESRNLELSVLLGLGAVSSATEVPRTVLYCQREFCGSAKKRAVIIRA
jgi:hypothetical protein